MAAYETDGGTLLISLLELLTNFLLLFLTTSCYT